MRADANAGVHRRLAVVADGVGVAAVNRLRHHKPQHERRAQEEPGRGVQAEKPRLGEVDQRPVEMARGLFAVVDEDEAPVAEHGAERDDEGVDPCLPDDQPVECPERGARQKCERPAHGYHPVSEAREDRPCHAVEQHDRGERVSRPDREIDIAVDHDDRHSERNDPDGGGLLQQQEHVVEVHERLVGDRDELADDREEGEFRRDEGPDGALLYEGGARVGVHFRLPPQAIGERSRPRLAAMSSQTARMMMTQVTTYWA